MGFLTTWMVVEFRSLVGRPRQPKNRRETVFSPVLRR